MNPEITDGQIGVQTDTQSAPKTTTETQPEKAEVKQSADTATGLMDFLDIPAEVQSQIGPKAEEKDESKTEDQPKAEAKAETAEDQAAEQETADEEAGEDEQEQEAEGADDQEPATTEKIDKRQKRINRLTRKNHQLEEQLDKIAAENQQFREHFGKLEGDKQRQQNAAPIGTGRLAHVADEQTLGQEVARANALMEWCDANAEGATTGEGENQKFIEPGEIAKWRREAEKIILNAPERREEIRSFTAARTHFNGLAQKAWPELFDKSNKDYQVASSILQQFPEIAARPEAAYAVGLVIEGMKALEAKQAANGANRVKEQNSHAARGDIDARAFGPRVPLAPHTANPPSREVKPSLQKKLNEARTELVKDSDGGVESLTKVFAAMDEAGATRSGRPKPVTV